MDNPPRMFIHPALHFEDHFASVGIVDYEQKGWIITSERQCFLIDQTPFNFIPKPKTLKDFRMRWLHEDMVTWVKGQPSTTPDQILQETITLLNRFIEFRHPQEPVLVACWILGTYFHPLCLTFPRLYIQAEKGCGKSKLLSLISQLSFNGMLHIIPSSPVLYRLIAPFRPTLCIDEAESLAGEDHKALIAMINAGYKAGGSVSRCGGNQFEDVNSFEVFCPMALGGISGLNPTSEDRTLSIILPKGTDLNRINAEVDPTEPQIVWIRNQSYRLLLTGFNDFKTMATSLVLPPWLNGRHRELYKPLMAIANWCDQHSSVGFQKNLLALAEQECGVRNGLSSEASELLYALEVRLGTNAQILLRPKEIANSLLDPAGKPMSAEKVGHTFKRLGFLRKRDSYGTYYQIERTQLEDIKTRYPQF